MFKPVLKCWLFYRFNDSKIQNHHGDMGCFVEDLIMPFSSSGLRYNGAVLNYDWYCLI